MSVGSRRGGGAVFGVAVAVVLSGCTETPRAGIGEPCELHDDCVTSAQCFAGACSPRCTENEQCGAGYICRDDGACERVVSQVGDPCARELDCGPSQACRLEPTDSNGDGWLTATCEHDREGAVTGARCAQDQDCRTGLCALGRCSEVCAVDDDCPDQLACVDVPRLLPEAAPAFHGCLLAHGRLELDLPVATPTAALRVAVPSHAVSVALVTSVADPHYGVGVTRVDDPRGALLYRSPVTENDYYANAIRYRPARGVSTLLLSNAPEVPLRVGAYDIGVASFHPSGGISLQVPTVRAVYKLADRPPATGTLDVELVFLDLDDHPCAARFPGRLNAATAAESRNFEAYLAALDDILGGAGVSIGDVVLRDLSDRPDLDAIDAAELPALLEQSTATEGLTVFFVRSIEPEGVQALAGGIPGTPGIPGTAASGIAVSMSTLCYRDWDELARTTAHTAARQLGLFPNLDPGGHPDAIADSEPTPDNLLYFGDRGGTALSPSQADVLRRNPSIR